MLPPRVVHRVRNCFVYQLNYKVLVVGLVMVMVVVVLLAGGAMDSSSRRLVHDMVDPHKLPTGVKVTKRSQSYSVDERPSCWGLDCDLPNNYHARGPCATQEATDWMEIGVKAMGRYLQGDRVTSSEEADYMNRFLEDAAIYFIGAITADPTCARAHTNLALVYMEQQKFQSALHHISTGIELNSEEPRYYAIRSFLHELMFNDPDRIKDREVAVKLDPFICERKYFAILLCNTTEVDKYIRWPQILQYSPQAEVTTARKFLMYIEFAAVSISNYGLSQPNVADFFVDHKYIVLRKLIPPFLLREIQTCYRVGIDSGRIAFMDNQAIRYVAQNDRCGRLLMFNLVDLVRKTIAHNARPSYCYFGGYVNGSALNPHSDRPQCEFTFSITLQQNPQDEPWGLGMYRVPQFEKNDNWPGRDREPWPEDKDQIWVDLYEGDGLLFMGRHMIHFRKGKLLGENRWVNQVFLHYVQENFKGTLD